jgi:hypothetical protein
MYRFRGSYKVIEKIFTNYGQSAQIPPNVKFKGKYA